MHRKNQSSQLPSCHLCPSRLPYVIRWCQGRKKELQPVLFFFFSLSRYRSDLSDMKDMGSVVCVVITSRGSIFNIPETCAWVNEPCTSKQDDHHFSSEPHSHHPSTSSSSTRNQFDPCHKCHPGRGYRPRLPGISSPDRNLFQPPGPPPNNTNNHHQHLTAAAMPPPAPAPAPAPHRQR